MFVDLHCDLGEGCPHDAELMELITSANVSCGAHAGEPGDIFATLVAARKHSVQVGAHPSYPDREHFGRRELQQDPEIVRLDCGYQIGALLGLARMAKVAVRYVKPHGALYNQASRDPPLADAIVSAAAEFELGVMGLPDSELKKAAATHRRRFIAEGFADRRYRGDGSLVPRSEPDAFVHDPDEAVRQAVQVIRDRGVESICVHGDNPQALAFVRALRRGLTDAGFQIRAFTP
jgi:UPF0271 protein